jgi:hypothetical protein
MPLLMHRCCCCCCKGMSPAAPDAAGAAAAGPLPCMRVSPQQVMRQSPGQGVGHTGGNSSGDITRVNSSIMQQVLARAKQAHKSRVVHFELQRQQN